MRIPILTPMESSVLLRSTKMIRSLPGCNVTAMSSFNRITPKLRTKQPLKSGMMRSFKDCAVRRAMFSINCSAQSSTPYSEDLVKPHPEVVEGNGLVQESAANDTGKNQVPLQQQQKSAKIHDFCFGIPFGGAVLISGIVGFSIARDVATLCNSVLFGGALLWLSTTSLKVWRKGESSFRYILGQSAIAAVILWNSFQGYLLTKKMLPNALYAAISAAMLCFYSYVVISGGNPPPKKLKPQA